MTEDYTIRYAIDGSGAQSLLSDEEMAAQMAQTVSESSAEKGITKYK